MAGRRSIKLITYRVSVAFCNKEINSRLVKRRFDGRLANRGLISLVKEAMEDQ